MICYLGSKETAFLYAVTSAGVVHVVSKACSSGNLTECNCDLYSQGDTTPEGWKWGGCRYVKSNGDKSLFPRGEGMVLWGLFIFEFYDLFRNTRRPPHWKIGRRIVFNKLVQPEAST